MANLAYKYRIYPNNEQRTQLAKTFGCVRFVYNKVLDKQNENYKSGEKHMSKLNANSWVNHELKTNYEWLKEVDKFALTNSIYHCHSAFDNFFHKRAKFPKFKSKHKSAKSYTTNFTNRNIEVGADYIKLPKLGKVKAVIHRIPKGVLKSATVSQDSTSAYYVSVLFEYELNVKKVPIKTELALDYKSNNLFHSSENEEANIKHFYRIQEKKLKRQQHKLSRKKFKSHNYYKQKLKVAKLHKHIANERKDFLHKKSFEIANQYDAVYVEDLNMSAIANKHFGNGKSTLDNGYGMFLKMLKYKLENQGKYFIKVDKWYPSSQICSNCGQVHKEMKNLKLRTLVCDCGTIIDRDLNAARNILNEGHRLAFK